MNSKAFVQSIQQKLDPIAPIVLPGIIIKQLQEVEATEENLTPEQAKQFIEKMKEALEMFLGPEGTDMVHRMMLKELRKYAPEHFEEQALV